MAAAFAKNSEDKLVSLNFIQFYYFYDFQNISFSTKFKITYYRIHNSFVVKCNIHYQQFYFSTILNEYCERCLPNLCHALCSIWTLTLSLRGVRMSRRRGLGRRDRRGSGDSLDAPGVCPGLP